jgi:hypothetical protein
MALERGHASNKCQEHNNADRRRTLPLLVSETMAAVRVLAWAINSPSPVRIQVFLLQNAQLAERRWR